MASDVAFRPPELATPSAMELFCRGREYESDGCLDMARALYRSAAVCESVAADALVACGRVERQLSMLTEAIRSLTNCLHYSEEDPGLSFQLYVEIGDIYAQLGDYGEATYHYRRASRYEPSDTPLQRRLRSASWMAEAAAAPRPGSGVRASQYEAATIDIDITLDESDEWQVATAS